MFAEGKVYILQATACTRLGSSLSATSRTSRYYLNISERWKNLEETSLKSVIIAT